MKRFIITLLVIFTLLQAQPPEKIRSKSAPLGVGLSLALPGAGQWYAENKGMAALYLTLEAAFIGGNIYFVRRGNTDVENYENYADVHWSVEDWLSHYDPANDPTTHTAIVYVDNRTYSPQNESSYNDMMADIEDGYQNLRIERDYHFYENIGKYEQFRSGWDDWTSGGEDPGDPMEGVFPKYSDNQYAYAGMRRKANNLLKIGGYFGTALFFNHFISAIDAGFRIKKYNDDREILTTLYCAPFWGASKNMGMRTGVYISF